MIGRPDSSLAVLGTGCVGVLGTALCALVGWPAAIAAQSAEARRLPAEQLIVLHPTRGEAALVSPASRAVLTRLRTGAGSHEVALSPDSRYAYVANYGSVGTEFDGERPGPAAGLARGISRHAGPGGTGSITVLDLVSATVLTTLYPGPYRRLHGIRVSPNGRRLWLTAEADSGVLELDARTGALLMLWKTGGADSHTLVASPEGRKLFVANRGSSNVTVLDRATVVAHRIPTGPFPEGIDISPDGREVWVASRGDHSLTVIDARKQRAVARLPSGGTDPVRLRFSPDGREVWVASRGSRGLAVFDVRSRELIGRVALEAEPWALVFAPDGRELFVGTPADGRVVVVDVRRRQVSDAFSVGPVPAGLAWSRLAPPVAAAGGQ
ncbi:MAG: YncE family protein [Gemmatimonadota bacterium]